MENETTENLVTKALAEEDEDTYWDIVSELHKRGTRNEFEIAAKLCQSEDAIEREIGSDILGQLGFKSMAFQREAISCLLPLLNDKEIDVSISAAYALGHRKSEEAIPGLIKHKNHPNDELRLAVVFGLLTQENAGAIETMIELSADENSEVRNWATFGIGSQVDLDSPVIRKALEENLEDEVSEIRGEAFVGLARRGDSAIVDKLIKELSGKLEGTLFLEAAELLEDPRLCPYLQKLYRALRETDSAYYKECLESALEYCN